MTDSLVAGLEEVLYSAYVGGGEAGIFGLKFSNASLAERATQVLRRRAGEAGVVRQFNRKVFSHR